MSKRITQKDLDGLIERLNRITNSPLEPYTKDESGKYTANIGNYHIDGAYGGWQLQRMQSEGCGTENVLGFGHVSKHDLYIAMHAYIRGLETDR